MMMIVMTTTTFNLPARNSKVSGYSDKQYNNTMKRGLVPKTHREQRWPKLIRQTRCMWGANTETKCCVVHAKGRLSLASGGQQWCRLLYTASADSLQIQAKYFFAIKKSSLLSVFTTQLTTLVSAAVTSRKWSHTCVPVHDNTNVQ